MARGPAEKADKDRRAARDQIGALSDRVNELLGVIAEKDRLITELQRKLAKR